MSMLFLFALLGIERALKSEVQLSALLSCRGKVCFEWLRNIIKNKQSNDYEP